MTSLNSNHPLNANDSRQASNPDGTSNVDRKVVIEATMEDDDASKCADGVHEAKGSTIGALTINDVKPIKTARDRFLQIVVDHFMVQHVVEVMDAESVQNEQDKLGKRKSRVERYEGDPQFVLPLMYVANIYETLVKEVDSRLASLDDFKGETIGVNLEAMGGLCRRLSKKFPEKGPLTFKRRELATPETKIRFPELEFQEEKGLHLVVADGLDIIERPVTLSVSDAEWFKKLTGRSEVSISANDYKFYSSENVYQRVVSNFLPSNTDEPLREKDMGDLKILQKFIYRANEYCYFERNRKMPGTDVVTDLVYSQPESLTLLRAFPYVLIVDSVHRENRFKIPFFEVLGYTCTGKNFNMACAFISAEREDNYVWVLNQISELYQFVGVTPQTIVTLADPDQELFKAVECVFPHTKHLLGRHQIYNKIEGKCLKDPYLSSIATKLISACKTLFESKTEEVYKEHLALMEREWNSKEGLITYLKQTWLVPYKDKIVSAWVDKVLHFGTNTMIRVESSCSSLKHLLSSSDSSYDDFELLWHELNAEIKGQKVDILMSFDHFGSNIPRNVMRIRNMTPYRLSDKAFRIMSEEYKGVKTGNKCMCQLRVSHGLPCPHEIKKYAASKTEIPLEAIHLFWWQHQFWWKLDPTFVVPQDPCSLARAFLVDLFVMFREMEIGERMRCKNAVKKILQSSVSMKNDRSTDFFRNFFTCEWYSEPGIFSSEDELLLETLGEEQILPKGRYNDGDKSKKEALSDPAILKQFLKQATKHHSFVRHRKALGTDIVTDLVFAGSDALALLRLYPHVLIIDTTSKENRYNIPCFEVLGLTAKWKSFCVACAFVGAEREENYLWVLNQISDMCWFVGATPKTIVTMTDPDQGLFNAVERAFPHTNHLLSRHYFFKSILEKCLKEKCALKVASAFLDACKSVIESNSENIYEKQLASLEIGWKSMHGMVEYLKQTWLIPYKEKIVSAWTNIRLHYGSHAVKWVKSALGKCLSSSDSSFYRVWFNLRMDLVSQTNEINFPVDYTPCTVPRQAKEKDILDSLLFSVSHRALKIMAEEYIKCVDGGHNDPEYCVCQLRSSYGLPCSHEMAKYVDDKTKIPPGSVDSFWTRIDDDSFTGARDFVLDLFVRFREMLPNEQRRCEFAVNHIIQAVDQPPTEMEKDQSKEFLRKWFSFGYDFDPEPEPEDVSNEGKSSPWILSRSSSLESCQSCDLYRPTYTCEDSDEEEEEEEEEDEFEDAHVYEKPFNQPGLKLTNFPQKPLIQPQMPINRPQMPLNQPFFNSANNLQMPFPRPWFNSAFPPQMPPHRPFFNSANPPQMLLVHPYYNSANNPQEPSIKPCVDPPYIHEIPNFMVPYVSKFHEYNSYEHNSGFQAIADGVEHTNTGWRLVRGDLFKELTSHSDVYAPALVFNTVEQTIKALANWSNTSSSPEQQLSIPDMGHLVATQYQLLFVVLGQQCFTFLPLYIEDQARLSDIKELCLVYMHHGSRFISVTMDEEFPLPPIHTSWALHHQKSIDGLDVRYADRLKKYKWLQSCMDEPQA